MPGAHTARRAGVLLALGAVAGVVVTAALLVGRAAGTPASGSTPTAVAPLSSPTDAAPTPTAMPRPLVCVDPGHSIGAPNIQVTVPVVDGQGRTRDVTLSEVNVNLDVAREVVRLLRLRFGAGAVIMTWGEVDHLSRAWDPLRGPVTDDRADVLARGAFCVAHGARSVVSIHTNAFGDAPDGTDTGYRPANGDSLAAAVHSTIYEALSRDPSGAPIPGFTDYGLDSGEWFIALGVDDPSVPVAILEPVMMSDPAEARMLLPTIRQAPDGRRAQIARVEATAVGAWIASTLLAGR